MTIQAPSAALAIDGGDPVRPLPMPPRIQVDERELDAVSAVFRRRMVDGGAFDRYDGPEVDTYERELADYFGVGSSRAYRPARPRSTRPWARWTSSPARRSSSPRSRTRARSCRSSSSSAYPSSPTTTTTPS